MSYVVEFQINYQAYDGWRRETYAETVEANDEDGARIIAGGLMAASLADGETATLTAIMAR